MTLDETSRRRYPRIPSENAVLVNRLGNVPAEEIVVTRNVGLGGCSFVSGEPYGLGLHLDLLITVEGQIVRTKAQLVYSNPLEDGRYEIGVEFLEIGDADREKIARLVAPR